MSREKTFTLSEPVTVADVRFTEVTMRHFKGRDLIAFKARAGELKDAGDEAQFILCEIASGAPAELFKDMDLADFTRIVQFMAPAFTALGELVGNDPTTKAETAAGSKPRSN